MSSSLFLWNYPDAAKNRVETLWGKLWFLDFLLQNKRLIEKLRDLNIQVAPWLQILSNNSLSRENQADLEKSLKWFDRAGLSDGEIIIRGSIPWDFRSLVDIIPTIKTQGDQLSEAIPNAIDEIRNKIDQIGSAIQKYASGMWVPWDMSALRFWVAPLLNVPILTATEHPNQDGVLLLDTYNWDYYLWWKNIDSTIYDSEGSSKRKRNSTHGVQIEKMLTYLRNEHILDSNIKYQFEYWVVPHGGLYLFQVKEFCKKQNPIIHNLGEEGTGASRALFSSLPEDETLDTRVISGTYHTPWREILENTSIQTAITLAPDRACELFPEYYDPRIRAYFHSDAHGGALNHDSFRTAQAVMQAGWVVWLGLGFSGALRLNYREKLQIRNDGTKIEFLADDTSSKSNLPSITDLELPNPNLRNHKRG